ncbi:MAG: hypothetical protein JWN44_172 [Myxococcales bacterium]|nr:hypothetical protein [Myxococcales bacterium]
MRTLVLSLLLVAAPALAQDKAAPETKTETKTETKSETKTNGKSKRSELVDLNTASADQLKTLPGMTDDIVKKIVAGRPYTGKDQLLKQGLVDKDEYAKIRPLVVAKQPKAMGGQGSVESHTGPGPSTDKSVKDAAAKPAANDTAKSTDAIKTNPSKPSDPTRSPAATKTPDTTKK